MATPFIDQPVKGKEHFKENFSPILPITVTFSVEKWIEMIKCLQVHDKKTELQMGLLGLKPQIITRLETPKIVLIILNSLRFSWNENRFLIPTHLI